MFAGGGTGGHLYPALRLADGLRDYAERHALAPPEICFLGNPCGVEGTVLPGHERFYSLPIQGFHRGRFGAMLRSNLKFPSRAVNSYRIAAKVIRREHPDVVVGTGGYVSGPPVFAAALRGIPTLIQEQNSYPGITTRLLAYLADRIHVAYEEAARMLPKKKRLYSAEILS